MESIWYKGMEIPQMDTLSGSRHVDVAVIGGGLAGILTACFLKQAGLDVLVIEGNRIGSGQTGRTTAKITVSHNLIYDNLIRKMGWNQALQYARANVEALHQYKKMIRELNLDCDFRECPSYLYTVQNKNKKLFGEAEAAKRLGLPAELTDHTELPFPVTLALSFDHQACFHPLKFLYGIAGKILNKTCIVENTPVEHVVENRVLTPYGTVLAEHIVFASHFPFMNIPGYYFMRMHQERSYVAAFSGCGRMQGMYLGIDPAPSVIKGNASGKGLSFRSYGDYMLLGGYGHRTGDNLSGGQYDRLKELADFYWPGCSLEACWSAQDGMTVSSIPYIGRYSSRRASWYVAAGFQKWGMTSSMVSALLLSRMIQGETCEIPCADVFSPQHLRLGKVMPQLISEGIHSGKNLLKQNLLIPGKLLKHVPPGHGDIVWYEGKKVGVYRDEDGKLYFVTTKCPHLGCQLSWNPEERSWDCPCHGSRFDYKGNLLDNPAGKGIGIKI